LIIWVGRHLYIGSARLFTQTHADLRAPDVQVYSASA
jgi:hypothetical protein